MSRIILSIINSVLTPEIDQYVFYHSNHKKDLDIARTIAAKCLVFEENQADTNKILQKIEDKEISINLQIRPKLILNSDIFKYENAKNLSNILRIPLFNIFYEIKSPLRKEAIFQVAPQLNKDINIIFNQNLVTQLCLSRYHLINDYNLIPNIFKQEYAKWKQI